MTGIGGRCAFPSVRLAPRCWDIAVLFALCPWVRFQRTKCLIFIEQPASHTFRSLSDGSAGAPRPQRGARCPSSSASLRKVLEQRSEGGLATVGAVHSPGRLSSNGNTDVTLNSGNREHRLTCPAADPLEAQRRRAPETAWLSAGQTCHLAACLPARHAHRTHKSGTDFGASRLAGGTGGEEAVRAFSHEP